MGRSAQTSLPLRITIASGYTTLVNATSVAAGSFSAEAVVPPLVQYIALLRRQLRAGQQPTSGIAYVTTKPTPVSERVVAPLHITGTIGGRKVDTILESRLVVRGSGPIRLTVAPVIPNDLLAGSTAGLPAANC